MNVNDVSFEIFYNPQNPEDPQKGSFWLFTTSHGSFKFDLTPNVNMLHVFIHFHFIF